MPISQLLRVPWMFIKSRLSHVYFANRSIVNRFLGNKDFTWTVEQEVFRIFYIANVNGKIHDTVKT